MYQNFYRLHCKPFENTPDPDFIFLSNQHREALSSLLYGIESGKGFILITGSVGTGKTTIIRTFLQQTGSDYLIINITNPKTSFADVLELLGKKLVLDQTVTNQLEWIDLLKERLIELNNQGHRIVILIDEAHLLQEESLEEIRLLSNIEHEKKKLIQIVLSGQNEIYELLARKRQKSLQQRIVINRQLVPLNEEETGNYIKHRLLVAGSAHTIFAKDALKLIWKKSQGSPRLINHLCDNALLIGYATESSTIHKVTIKEVIHDMDKRAELAPRIKGWQPSKQTLLVAVAAISVMLVTGIFWGGQKQSGSTLNRQQPTATNHKLYSSVANKKSEEILVTTPLLTTTNNIKKLDGQVMATQLPSPLRVGVNAAVHSISSPILSTKSRISLYPGILKIKPHEPLGRIAYRAYGTSSETVIDFLQRENGIKNIDQIYSGKFLRLPLITPDTLISQMKNGLFHIHYASFYSDTDAKNVTHKLQRQGKKAYFKKYNQGENQIYRIYIGDFTSRHAAESALKTIDFKYLDFLNDNVSIATY